jgi:ATP-dependent helicase/nuclease subunit A
MSLQEGGNWLQFPGCLIQASAGTGKTTRLISEIVRAVRAGALIERVAAMTFTHQAAGEMKLRLRRELQSQFENTETPVTERESLRTAIEHIEEAFVGTIHGFCAHLLRQRPIEVGLDPAFREISAMEASILFSKVFRTWIEKNLRAGSAVLEAAFCRMAWSAELGRDPVSELRKEAWKLAEWRDFDCAWTRRPLEHERDLGRLLDRLASIVAQWKVETASFKYLRWKLLTAAELGDRVPALRETRTTDRDACVAELSALANRSYELADFGSMHDRQRQFYSEWESFIEELKPFQREADATLATDLHTELRSVVEEYTAAKMEIGLVDFQDLLLYARDLMKQRATREWFQKQFDHIFVDEFQDTDPIQAEIIMLLTSSDGAVEHWQDAVAAKGKLFLVGDPKQSIYGFRRADLSFYHQVALQLERAGAHTDPLQHNYRSVASIQHFVNAAFEDQMLNYLSLEGGRDDLNDQPGVAVLPVPEVFGWTAETKGAIEASAPKAIAGLIRWLVDSSDWLTQHRDGTMARISESDICVLFRRFTPDVTNGYVRSLERQNIRHVLIGSKSLHDREEVMTLCAALRAIEDPYDELNVYATLRGSLFAIDDATLYRFKNRKRSTEADPVGGPIEGDTEVVPTALDVIRTLHRRRNHQGITTTINQLLEATRAHAGFALRPGGERVLANVTRIIDLARRFEMTAATSFRSFVDFLEDEAGASDAGEAPLLEHDAEGVRLMTVHKAKGLDFPVVILADPTCRLVRQDQGRYVDAGKRLCAHHLLGCAPWDLLEHEADQVKAEREEAQRLAYVAATRARDLLIISAIGTTPWSEGWLSPLHDAIYPVSGSTQCVRSYPGFKGKTTVFGTPKKGKAPASLMPGWHKPRRGTGEILWIDPLILPGEQEVFDGVSNMELLQGDPTGGLSDYGAWSQGRKQAVEAGARPTWNIVAATSRHLDVALPAIDIERIEVPADGPRPSSMVFGKLVHAILQDTNLKTGDNALDALSSAHSRRLGLTPEHAMAASKAVRTTLSTPIFERARRAQKVLRESPFILRTQEGVLIEGQIDLAFHDADGWTVVDYKTGRSDRQEYEDQLRLYSLALGANDGPVKGVLLEIK